jgi:hypothetical protein
MQHGSEKVDKPSCRDKFRKEKREKPSGSEGTMVAEKRGGGGSRSGPGGPPTNPSPIRLLAKRGGPPCSTIMKWRPKYTPKDK